MTPSRPAASNVAGSPAEVSHVGSSALTGRGCVRTSISSPAPLTRLTASPRQSARTVAMPSASTRLRSAWLSGASTKSSASQPDANDTSARPPDSPSTTDHSSATRSGSCNGSTTLPARMAIRSVTAAMAAPVTAGLG